MKQPLTFAKPSRSIQTCTALERACSLSPAPSSNDGTSGCWTIPQGILGICQPYRMPSGEDGTLCWTLVQGQVYLGKAGIIWNDTNSRKQNNFSPGVNLDQCILYIGHVGQYYIYLTDPSRFSFLLSRLWSNVCKDAVLIVDSQNYRFAMWCQIYFFSNLRLSNHRRLRWVCNTHCTTLSFMNVSYKSNLARLRLTYCNTWKITSILCLTSRTTVTSARGTK